MAESTLSLVYSDLAGEVGLFLGHGRGAALGDPAWSAQQQAVVDSCVRSGLRNFYFPPPLDGQETSYDWSFLRPTVSLTLPPGAGAISLPDDFGGVEGEIALLSAQSQSFWPVSIAGEGAVRQKYSELPNSTGRPVLAAVAPIKGTSGAAGQRFQLLVWPLADAAYALQLAYYVNADYLSVAFPHHLGGMAHAETILESCLAVAEQRLDDAASVHTMKFKERLAASVGADRKMKPQALGYNADRSDLRGRRRHGRDHDLDNLVTVRGTLY